MSPLPKRTFSALKWATVALAEARDDVATAKMLLAKWWNENPEIDAVLRAYTLQRLFWEVNSRKRQNVAKVFSVEKQANTPPKLLEMARERVESLLDKPLLGGKRLGECTKDDLDEAIKQYSTLVRTHSRMIKFLTLVKQKLGNRGCVEDAMDHAALVKLQIATDKIDG